MISRFKLNLTLGKLRKINSHLVRKFKFELNENFILFAGYEKFMKSFRIEGEI